MSKGKISNKINDFFNKENKEKAPSEMLDIKIGTPDEALWTDVIKGYEDAISNFEKQLKVNKVFLEAAKLKLKEAEVQR